MLSSDRMDRVRLAVHRWWVCGGVLLAACSVPPAPSQTTATPSAPVACVGADTAATPHDASALAALRRSVETGPLYAAAVAASAVVMCRVRLESGVMALEYQFRDAGWLHVKRDARIEYIEQEAHFASPPAEPPEALLARAEQAAFGVSGCGIDWRQPETLATEGNSGAKDTVFRGDVCNCQARIRRDAGGRVVGLALRSTC